MMPRSDFRAAAIAVLLPLALTGCSPQPVVPATAELNYEGLTTVRSRRFAHVDVRPGVDFTRYEAVHALPPDLEFRTPDRAQQQFPLSAEQKTRFHDALVASLREEFTASSSLELVDRAGPEVIALEVRVIDITAVVPAGGGGRVGPTSIALDATGSVTFVLEVSDSESGELLARAVETRSLSGGAMLRGNEMLTAWDDVDRLCDRWAEASRTGLEELLRHDGSGT